MKLKYSIIFALLISGLCKAQDQIIKFKTNYIIDDNNEARFNAEVTINGNYVSVLSDVGESSLWLAETVDSLNTKVINDVTWYRCKNSGSYVSYSVYKGGKTFGVLTSSNVMYYFAYKPDEK